MARGAQALSVRVSLGSAQASEVSWVHTSDFLGPSSSPFCSSQRTSPRYRRHRPIAMTLWPTTRPQRIWPSVTVSMMTAMRTTEGSAISSPSSSQTLGRISNGRLRFRCRYRQAESRRGPKALPQRVRDLSSARTAQVISRMSAAPAPGFSPCRNQAGSAASKRLEG
jgi:hypothetical protein